jgi:CubicO group peptidase (beta-lactamase class C family)
MKWSAAIGRTDHALTWNVAGFACPLVYPPGQGWMYSSALDWAGFVLEQVTGKKLGAYMDEHIFTPLGMKNTTFWPHARADLKDRLAATPFRPTNEEGGGEPLVPAPSPAPVEHEVESGGAGLYSTAADYVKFVAAIMRGDKVLFAKPETRELLFAPQLDDVQRTAMRDVVARLQSAMAPEFPPGLAIDFAFGGMLNMEDLPGRRRKGSVMWSGLANAHWWIDRETGVAGVFFTTVLRNPPGDPVVIRLYRELEEAVYADLVGK